EDRPLLVAVAVAVEGGELADRRVLVVERLDEGGDEHAADGVVEGGAVEPAPVGRVERAAGDLARGGGEQAPDRGGLGGDGVGQLREPLARGGGEVGDEGVAQLLGAAHVSSCRRW